MRCAICGKEGIAIILVPRGVIYYPLGADLVLCPTHLTNVAAYDPVFNRLGLGDCELLEWLRGTAPRVERI